MLAPEGGVLRSPYALRGRLPHEHTCISCRARARLLVLSVSIGATSKRIQRVSRVNVLGPGFGDGLCILYRVRAGALALIVAFLASPGKFGSPALLIFEKLHTREKCVCWCHMYTLPRLI
jgi:hypothetical protein